LSAPVFAAGGRFVTLDDVLDVSRVDLNVTALAAAPQCSGEQL